MLKRNPSLTDQARAHIKERILNEGFVNDRIPSETDLADELGVSRTTIRDALSRLELEGVIYRKQGAGTFINTPGLQIKTRLEEIWSYETMLRAHGYATSTRIITVKRQSANHETLTDLSLASNDEVLTVQKLILADDHPVIVATNHIPVEIITHPYTNSDFHTPIFDFLANFSRQSLAYYLSDIVPVNAPHWLAEILNVRVHQALLSFTEIGYTQDNIAIIKAHSYFRDDLLRLRLIRREV